MQQTWQIAVALLDDLLPWQRQLQPETCFKKESNTSLAKKVRPSTWVFEVTNATASFQMPKMLFESGEEPTVVLELLWIRPQQQDQTWREGTMTDRARRPVQCSQFFAFYCESKYSRHKWEDSLTYNPIRGSLKARDCSKPPWDTARHYSDIVAFKEEPSVRGREVEKNRWLKCPT